jgi:hypothetical protein
LPPNCLFVALFVAVLLVDPESQQILAVLPPALEGCEQQPAALQRLAFLADGLHLVSAA